jgi:hypothetical protein
MSLPMHRKKKVDYRYELVKLCGVSKERPAAAPENRGLGGLGR